MRFPITIPQDRDFDAVGFGTNAVDYLVTVPEYPKFDSKIRLTDYVQAAGGEIATTMSGISRLGLRTAYIGRFGDDREGTFGLDSLRAEGIDVSQAEIVEGCKTQIAFIIIDARNGERTVIWDRDEKLGYRPDEVPSGFVSRGRILHVTPHDSAACVVLAQEAKTAGTIVSMDIDNTFDGVENLFPLADVVITSAEFPERLLGIADAETALVEMRSRYGWTVAGITLGESGSLLYCDGSFIRSEGFPVPGGCKDTTGAGDSFRAGLLYGLLKGEDVETAARIANAVAALKCREVGARTALPTEAELRSLLAGD